MLQISKLVITTVLRYSTVVTWHLTCILLPQSPEASGRSRGASKCPPLSASSAPSSSLPAHTAAWPQQHNENKRDNSN